MSASNLQHYLDLHKGEIDLEMFGAALAVKHRSMLIANSGNEFGWSDWDYSLHPLDLQKFLAHIVETAQLIRRFEVVLTHFDSCLNGQIKELLIFF